MELGGVIAAASVGALLQNRLAVALHDQAVRYSTQLPDQFRSRFIDGFSSAAKGGLEVGAGQSGASLPLPAGLPTQVVLQLQQLGHEVFTNAFVSAMRPTLLLPIAVVLLVAVSCIGVRNRPPVSQLAEDTETPASSAA